MFGKKVKIPVEVSARHCHLCQKDLDALFGVDYKLTKLKQLSQSDDFACQETVKIKFGSKEFENVRIVGPVREKTQVEISFTDAIGSGILPKIKISGDLENSDAVSLDGPAGSVGLSEGLIVAQRHLHCSLNEAKKLGLKNNSKISVKIEGLRGLIFDNVEVRVKDNYNLSMHIDTDEGNAAGINKIGEGIIL